MILKGAPPVVLTKYEFVHNVGNLRLSSENARAQEARSTAFGHLHQPMNAKLWVYIDQQMHMVWHYL